MDIVDLSSSITFLLQKIKKKHYKNICTATASKNNIRETTVLILITSNLTKDDNNKTVTGIMPKITFNLKGVINFKLENIHTLVIIHIKHNIKKNIKKLSFDNSLSKLCLKLIFPKKPTLKNFNKHTTEHKATPLIKLTAATKTIGFKLLLIKAFSNTDESDIPNNAIKANIKPT